MFSSLFLGLFFRMDFCVSKACLFEYLFMNTEIEIKSQHFYLFVEMFFKR